MLEAPCAEPFWATFCSTASLQGSGAPLLQPTAPRMTERAGATAGRTGMPGEPQTTAEHCPRHGPTYTPWMLSHSRGCSFPQPALQQHPGQPFPGGQRYTTTQTCCLNSALQRFEIK